MYALPYSRSRNGLPLHFPISSDELSPKCETGIKHITLATNIVLSSSLTTMSRLCCNKAPSDSHRTITPADYQTVSAATDRAIQRLMLRGSSGKQARFSLYSGTAQLLRSMNYIQFKEQHDLPKDLVDRIRSAFPGN
eukprot:656635_1